MTSNRHDFLVINDWARHTGWLHVPMEVYATYGVVLFGLLLVLGWWVSRRAADERRTANALAAGVGVLVAVAVNQPIVHAVHELRPFEVLPHILVLAHRSTDFSFPSDHATMAGAAAAGLFYVRRRLGIIASVAALVLAFARVYIAAHWPRDVLAGLVLGIVVAVVVQLVLSRVLTWFVRRVSATPLRPLVTTAR